MERGAEAARLVQVGLHHLGAEGAEVLRDGRGGVAREHQRVACGQAASEQPLERAPVVVVAGVRQVGRLQARVKRKSYFELCT